MIRTSSAPIIVAAVSCLLLVATASSIASAAEIKVLSPTRLKPAMVEVIQQFEKSSGYKVAVDYGTVGALAGHLQKGEGVDVAISLHQQIAAMQNYTVVTAGIVANSKEPDAAKALIQFIFSPAATAVLKAKGYERP